MGLPKLKLSLQLKRMKIKPTRKFKLKTQYPLCLWHSLYLVFSDWNKKEVNDGENIRDDSGSPDQPTKGKEGLAQVKSLPHGQTNLRLRMSGSKMMMWMNLFLLDVSLH